MKCRICGARSLELREVDFGSIGKAKVCPACIAKAQHGDNFSGHQLSSAPPPDLKVFVVLRKEHGEAVFVNLMSTIYAFYREEDARGYLKALKAHPNITLVGNEEVEQVFAQGLFEWAVTSKRRLISIVAGVPKLPAPKVNRKPNCDDEGGRAPQIFLPPS